MKRYIRSATGVRKSDAINRVIDPIFGFPFVTSAPIAKGIVSPEGYVIDYRVNSSADKLSYNIQIFIHEDSISRDEYYDLLNRAETYSEQVTKFGYNPHYNAFQMNLKIPKTVYSKDLVTEIDKVFRSLGLHVVMDKYIDKISFQAKVWYDGSGVNVQDPELMNTLKNQLLSIPGVKSVTVDPDQFTTHYIEGIIRM